VKDTVLNRSS